MYAHSNILIQLFGKRETLLISTFYNINPAVYSTFYFSVSKFLQPFLIHNLCTSFVAWIIKISRYKYTCTVEGWNTVILDQRARLDHPALHRTSHLCIPFLGIARRQSKLPQSLVYERFIYVFPGSVHIFSCSVQCAVCSVMWYAWWICIPGKRNSDGKQNIKPHFHFVILIFKFSQRCIAKHDQYCFQ
jgi:hypothetical protein